MRSQVLAGVRRDGDGLRLGDRGASCDGSRDTPAGAGRRILGAVHARRGVGRDGGGGFGSSAIVKYGIATELGGVVADGNSDSGRAVLLFSQPFMSNCWWKLILS